MRTASKFLTLAALMGSVSLHAAQQDVAFSKPVPTTPGDANTARATDGRPATLVQAETDIRTGQPGKAEEALSVWVVKNSASLYRSEGLYLLGQAQFYQGKYSEAKKSQDDALDAKPNHVLKALEMFSRADCNMKLGQFGKASRQYHWVEQFYRDVRAVPHDELMFKLGLASKLDGFPEWGNYWFNKVVELYATSPWAPEARRLNTELNGEKGEPKYYTLACGYYTDPKKAEAEAAVFKQKGYKDVEVKRFGFGDTTYYEVHIGKFFNKLDAQVAKDDADLSGSKFSVRPAPIVPEANK